METQASYFRVRFSARGRRLFGLEADGQTGVNIELLVSWRERAAAASVLSQCNFESAIWRETTLTWSREHLCLKDYS